MYYYTVENTGNIFDGIWVDNLFLMMVYFIQNAKIKIAYYYIIHVVLVFVYINVGSLGEMWDNLG